jgi:hypothetical protein
MELRPHQRHGAELSVVMEQELKFLSNDCNVVHQVGGFVTSMKACHRVNAGDQHGGFTL